MVTGEDLEVVERGMRLAPRMPPAREYAPFAQDRGEHRLIVRFRLAATALAAAPDSADGQSASRTAADALVELAGAGARDALADILRPDPKRKEVTWTVACYQIGDLSPCAMQDFASPVEAVTTLARCDSAGHVAAELVAADASGLRWTALVRTGSLISWQLLDASSGRDGDDDGSLADARRRWQDRLLRWSGAPEADLGAPAEEAPTLPAAPALERLADSIARIEGRLASPSAGALAERMLAAEERCRALELQLQLAAGFAAEMRAVAAELSLRVTALERTPPVTNWQQILRCLAGVARRGAGRP